MYNKVTISIDETYLNQLTTRELKAAVYLDQIGDMKDVVEDLISTDYYSGLRAFPERYSLDIASLTPTGINNIINVDPFQDKNKFISSSDSTLKLL